MNASLVMFKADGTRCDFPLSKARTVVGRTNECDLRIALSSVSRQHCEFLVEGGKVKLRDLGSSNGTFRNDSRVQEADLSPGDEIGVGPVVFTVVVDGKPAKIEPVRSVVAKPAAPAAKPAAPKAPGAAKPAAPPPPADELPDLTEQTNEAPTVDLDDPIAALEAMSEGSSTTLPALTDDDETPPAKK